MKSLAKPEHPMRKAVSYALIVLSLITAAGVVYLIQLQSVRQEEKVGQETLLLTTLVKSDVAAIVLDETGKIILATPQLLKLTGYAETDLLNNTPDILMPVAYRALHRQGYSMRNTDTGQEKKHQINCQLRREDGTTLQVINNVFSYEKGGIAIITPNSEQDFQERLFTMARREAKVGVWWWEIDKDRLVWDGVMYDLFGVEEETWSPTYDGFQEGLHPDDRPWINDVVSRCIANRTAYRAVFRVIKKSTGETIYVRAYGSVMDGMDGPVFGGVNIEVSSDEFTGSAEEITPTPGER